MFNRKKVVSVLASFTLMVALSVSSFAYWQVRVDPRSYGKYSTQITNCIAKWNKVSPDYVRIEPYIGTGGSRLPFKPLKDGVCVFTFGACGIGVAGKTVDGDIYINPALITRPEYLDLLIGHELGHIMGVPHLDAKFSIMGSTLDYQFSFDYSSSKPSLEQFYLKNFTQLPGPYPVCAPVIGVNSSDGPGRLGRK